MKALIERDWELVGVCSQGLVFKNRTYSSSIVIEKQVRFVRTGQPDIFLTVGRDGVSIECNRRKLRSPSDLNKFSVPQNLVEASREVVTL